MELRDNFRMAQRDVPEGYEIAVKQGRHIETLLLGIIRFVLLVGAVEAVYLTQEMEEIPSIGPSVLAFLPLTFAFALAAAGLFSQSHLVVNPASWRVERDERDHALMGLDPWHFCVLNTSHSNWLSKFCLSWSLLFLVAAPFAFINVVHVADNLTSVNGWLGGYWLASLAFALPGVGYVAFLLCRVTPRPKPLPNTARESSKIIDLESRRLSAASYLALRLLLG